MKYKTSLFIFRRDLRYDDNVALINACEDSEHVLCVFIFTPEQIKENKYKSDNCVQFMCECLKELDISFFYGQNIDVIESVYKKHKFEAIYFNMDYTPYAVKRDKQISKWCKKHKIQCEIHEDYMLHNMGSVLTATNEPYVTYSAFRNKAKKISVPKPRKLENLKKRIYKCEGVSNQIKITDIKKFYKSNKYIHVNGGRSNAIKILKNIKKFDKYDDTRNNPSIQTTNLSAYNKFGCISIRELYHVIKSKLGADHALLDQLIWRDFYYNLLYYFPHSQDYSFYRKYDKIKWKMNETYFKKWCEGNTGFPMVDAGMRQLNKTGFMHNRARMIVAQFLTKTLHIHWKHGEGYFAKKLVDYDPAQNVGNWQWNASTGIDRFRFGIRTMNPYNIGEDKEANYIKKWVPELSNVPIKDIKSWDVNYKKYDTYTKPIVDYSEQIKKFKNIYNQIE